MPLIDYKGGCAEIYSVMRVMDLNEVRKVAETCARTIGRRMCEIVDSGAPMQVTSKSSDVDLVTEVDLWAENEITKAVKQRFPDHLIIGEETSSELARERGEPLEQLASRGICWVVDPIDGTANFVSGIPFSAVSIAVLKDGCTEFGLVYDPYRDELFTAQRGGGSTLNGKRVQVGTTENLGDAVASTSVPYDRIERHWLYREILETAIISFRKVRMWGAAALEMCWVGCGRFDIQVQYGVSSWDVAAAALFIEEAGGRVGCFASPPDSEYTIFAPTVLASNQVLFPKAMALISAAHHKALLERGITR